MQQEHLIQKLSEKVSIMSSDNLFVQQNECGIWIRFEKQKHGKFRQFNTLGSNTLLDWSKVVSTSDDIAKLDEIYKQNSRNWEVYQQET